MFSLLIRKLKTQLLFQILFHSKESFSSLKAELCELKISLMNEICEVGNSIRDIKAKKDIHSEQVKDNKDFGMNLKLRLLS